MINFDAENKYILEGTYQVSMSEKDMHYALKPAVLLNFMQDLAAKSIDKIDTDLSCDALLAKGLGWFLIRYRIEFDDYPIREVAQIKSKYLPEHSYRTYHPGYGNRYSEGYHKVFESIVERINSNK